MREPRDDLFAIALLLLGILSLRRNAFTGTKPTNIHTNAGISTPREVRMFGIVSRRGSVVLPIRQVLEQGRELLAGLRSLRHVERSCKTHPVFHGNPCLLHADSIDRC